MLDTTELRLESPVERGAEWIKLPAALWTLAGAMLVIRSAEVFYVPIMPLYARMLNVGVPLAVIGLVTSVDRLGTVVTGPFVGRWADRAGRRRPYLIGVGITAIASILGGVALGIFDLAAYRIISGIGTACSPWRPCPT
jgi:MFS family permease